MLPGGAWTKSPVSLTRIGEFNHLGAWKLSEGLPSFGTFSDTVLWWFKKRELGTLFPLLFDERALWNCTELVVPTLSSACNLLSQWGWIEGEKPPFVRQCDSRRPSGHLSLYSGNSCGLVATQKKDPILVGLYYPLVKVMLVQQNLHFILVRDKMKGDFML